MTMGYSACKVDIISEENIDRITGGRLSLLQEWLKIRKLDFHDLCEWQDDGEDDGEDEVRVSEETLERKLAYLREVFKRETGLTLYLGYHNSEEHGSAYDEVDGIFWEVEGVWQKTKAAQKIASLIQPAYYVQYG